MGKKWRDGRRRNVQRRYYTRQLKTNGERILIAKATRLAGVHFHLFQLLNMPVRIAFNSIEKQFVRDKEMTSRNARVVPQKQKPKSADLNLDPISYQFYLRHAKWHTLSPPFRSTTATLKSSRCRAVEARPLPSNGSHAFNPHRASNPKSAPPTRAILKNSRSKSDDRPRPKTF